MSTLAAKSISTGYGKTQVLFEVSITVRPGEVLAILGPNGCGKTTLLRSLVRMLPPWHGKVDVDGMDLYLLSHNETAMLISLVPQNEEAVFEFTVQEIVEMGRFAHRGEGKYRVVEAMEETACTTLAHKPITQLSGGERQRVLLARAIAQDAPIMLLDEPTAHMDVGYQIATLSQLRQLAREGRAVAAVLHDLNLAAGFADRAVLMHAGRIEAEGDVEDVLGSDIIERVYGTPFSRVRDPITGRLVLTPQFIPESSKAARPRRIHVIGGGGSAAPHLSELWQRGHKLTLGVALALDSDVDAAERMRIPSTIVPPFSMISAQNIDEAAELASDAEIVLVCPAPYGKGNVANLDLATRLLADGKQIVWLDWSQQPWDYTGGEAGRKTDALRAKNGVLWIHGDVAGAIEALP